MKVFFIHLTFKKRILFCHNIFLYIFLAGLISCHKNDSYLLQNPKSKSYKIKVKELQKKAKLYLNSANDSLNIIAEQLIYVGVQNKDTSVIVDGKLLKANYELRSSNYPGTVKTALESLSLAEKKHLFKKLPDIYSLIGNAYKENEDYHGALSAAKKALIAAQKLNDTSLIIGAMLDRAMFTHSYSMLTNNDSIANISLQLYLDGLHLSQTNPKYESLEVPFYDDISQYYKLTGDYKKGIYYGKKGAKLARKYNRKRSLTYSYNWLGEMYYYQGFRKKGMTYLDTALQYANDLKWGFRISEILYSKYLCYHSSGNARKALESYTLSQAIRDSLQMLKNVRQVSQLQIQYQTGKKDQQITMLNELNKEKTKRNIFTLAGLLIFFILSAFLFFLYRGIRIRSRKIKEQSEKLQLLMKELHHRVKNNLQIVSSLLSLQSNHLADKDAKQAVKIGQQRIEAMSLIHQSLYQQENPNMINMQEYVTNLVECILQSFNIDKNNFHLCLDIEITEMDVDMALPLGLIINEWVTNAFKYAYQECRKPALYISLKKEEEIKLEIRDNGPGISREAWEKPKGSFGVKLVKVLSKQLNGECKVENIKGTQLKLQIPLRKFKKAV